MNKKITRIIVLALGLSCVGISVSQADNNPPSKQRGMMSGGMMYGGMMNGGMMNGGMMNGGMMSGGMFLSQLNLTDEQLQKIQSIMETALSTMPQRQQMMANMPTHMAESQALLNNSTFDESKAREMISKRQALMADNQVDMLKAHHQAFQVLTEQQKVQFNALMAKHIAQMQQYMQGGQQ